MPAFRCDEESTFCIVKFGGEFGYLNKAIVYLIWPPSSPEMQTGSALSRRPTGTGNGTWKRLHQKAPTVPSLSMPTGSYETDEHRNKTQTMVHWDSGVRSNDTITAAQTA
jgi:hypothetical protein